MALFAEGKLFREAGTGSGGGDKHNKGYFVDESALTTAYPTAEAGDYAIVESTDTVWIWDSDNSEWKDSDQKGQVTSVNGQTGDVSLSIPDAVQYSTMPTASADNLGDIVQFTGTTDATYTNGYFYQCVSDGQDPATYSWTRVDVQPAPVIPDPLPSQTGQSGKFLTTDGTDASWSNKPLENKATNINSSVAILGAATSGNAIVIGNGSSSNSYQTVALGVGAVANYPYSWAVGNLATPRAHGAVQFGNGTNSDAGTVNFSLTPSEGVWNNYRLLNADGTIPEARLADTTNAAQGQVLTLDSNLNAVWQAGGGGSSYTAGTGIDITNGVVSLAGADDDIPLDDYPCIITATKNSVTSEVFTDWTTGYVRHVNHMDGDVELNPQTLPAVWSMDDPNCPYVYADKIVQYQYQDDTTLGLTEGYFYKSVEDVTKPEDVEIDAVNAAELTNVAITNKPYLIRVCKYHFGYEDNRLIFEYRGDSGRWWNLENETSVGINLTNVGIIYTGTPQDGDTIEVAYTAQGWEWQQINVQPSSGASGDYVPQYSTMPTAGAGNAGWIVQYAGATDVTYTHGYIYENIESLGFVGPAADATEGEPGESMVFALDADSFAAYLQTKSIVLSGQTTFYLEENSDPDTGDNIYALQDAGGVSIEEFTSLSDMESVTGITWGGQEDLTGDFPYSSENATGFIVGPTYAWNQIDVQPSSVPTDPTFNSITLSGTTSYHMEVASSYYLRIGTGATLSSNDLLIRTSGTRSIAFGTGGGEVGASSAKMSRVYTNKINNGADIAVPTTGGTMVVATPPSADGTYVLKATVADGVVTTTWVAE